MLLVLDDQHKEHLKFLNNLDSAVMREFCKLSIEFLQKGSNPKLYQTAAQKLRVDAEMVQHAIEGIMYLITEAVKMGLSDLELKDSMISIDLPEIIQEEIMQFHSSRRNDVRKELSGLSTAYPHYHNLKWRLDVQLATRSLRHQTTPLIMLKLELIQDEKVKSFLLQIDPVNLIHMTEVLDQALKESKLQHCRRIMRHIK
ncbi:COMM domain-containing protein 2-like [Centruroides sculpturatus]|uniref:COMM domain-containing protein 2-like n=1 Tax=Centruroides sculpturatus TaxID=218467 RepID=UPI000C6D9410|nr:COMM domain-containing protein 2-like [Centruroides sculpturatus]